MEIQEKLESMAQNSIKVSIGENEDCRSGATRFGGQPDVPSGFSWPTYEGKGFDDVVKERPLAFLAQFDCRDLAQYDPQHLLPDHGVLAFFYELGSQPWGFDPTDQGCARVYWFEDVSALKAAGFPEDLEEGYRLPMLKISLDQDRTYPSWEDFFETFPEENDYDAFAAAWEEQTGEDLEEQEGCSRLLGWPDVIQSSMYAECDLASQGYYLGNKEGWDRVPEENRKRAEETARDRWMLLFQLDTVVCGDFELMFGDCGRIYFYITKEDLKERRFDRVWLILQCG